MGGRGSGRTSGLGMLTDKCHEYRSIDLAWLARKTLLNVSRSSTLTWSLGGHETGSINFEMLQSGIRLVYRARRSGDDWQDIQEFVPIIETATNFGGKRRWFKCLSCQLRCRILYGGTYFRCRRCHRLKYESQYEKSYSSVVNQAHGLRKRLGHVGSLDDPFPDKPKGMHWKTYKRLAAKDADLQQRWAVGVTGWLNLLQ